MAPYSRYRVQINNFIWQLLKTTFFKAHLYYNLKQSVFMAAVVNYSHLKSAMYLKFNVSKKRTILFIKIPSNPSTNRGSSIHMARPAVEFTTSYSKAHLLFSLNLMRTVVMIAALNVNEWGKPCSLVPEQRAPSGYRSAT